MNLRQTNVGCRLQGVSSLLLLHMVLVVMYCGSVGVEGSRTLESAQQRLKRQTNSGIPVNPEFLAEERRRALGERSQQNNTEIRRPTSSANEFYIGFMQNFVKPANAPYSALHLNDTYLIITTDEPGGASVTVTHGDKETTYSVRPGTEEIVELSVGTFLLEDGVRTEGYWDRQKGIHVQADAGKRITLYGFNEEIHSVEGFTALPCTKYQTATSYEYFAVSVQKSTVTRSTRFGTPDSSFLIVACNDNTRLSITPTQNITNPNDPNELVAPGESVNFTLNRLETLYIESPEDLSGSHVISNLPITFISGHECGNVPHNELQCDHLVEQLPPTISWGKRFLIAPTADREASDLIRIVSSQSNTIVSISCNDRSGLLINLGLMSTITLWSAGDTTDMRIDPSHACHILSNLPILVVQFAPGVDADTQASPNGDPFMVLVPAQNQYVNNMIVSTAQGFPLSSLSFDHYLNIFVPESEREFNSSAITIDGHTVGRNHWIQVFCADNPLNTCGFVLQVYVSNSVAHRIVHSRPEGRFGAIVYGVAFLESYAYVGGLYLPGPEPEPGPMIVQPDQTSYIMFYGHNLCLSCELTPSSNPPSIQWMFGDTPLEELSDVNLQIFNNDSLCIINATSRHSGGYMCTAGSSTLEYNITVHAGILVQQPNCRPTPSSNQAFLIGIGLRRTTYLDSDSTSLEICCPTEGEVQSIAWLRNGVEISDGGRYQFGDGYLKVSAPFRDGCVVYTCQVTFEGDVVKKETSDICIGEFMPPGNITIAGEREILEGQPFQLTCSANGYPSPDIIWSQVSELLPRNASDRGNGVLFVRGLWEGELTSFCCEVSNERGAASKCAAITILIFPVIQEPTLPSIIITRYHHGNHIPPTTFDPSPQTRVGHVGQSIGVLENFDLRIDCEIARGYPAPIIAWSHDGNLIRNDSKHDIFMNGSLLIGQMTPMVDDGMYECIATNKVGRATSFSIVDVLVIPEIAPPLPPSHAPGSCKEDLQNTTILEQVGVDLCVGTQTSTTLSLTCNISRAIPDPTFAWYKDGLELNSSLADFTVYSDGTLLVENLRTNVESEISDEFDLTGLYTCVATNIAGSTNASSYVVPFGNVTQASINEYYRPLHIQLYRQLYSSVAEHVDTLETGEQHLVLLSTGKILSYDDYYPGRDFDGGEESVPSEIMERMFHLIDVIPQATSIVTDLDEAWSLSQTYEYLIDNLEIIPQDLEGTVLQEAREYLQQKVEDLGQSSTEVGATKLVPRLSLYLSYKNTYYLKKLEIESIMEEKKLMLPGTLYTHWYDQHFLPLQSQIDGAYMKWEMYGDKTEVEKKLDKLDLRDRSEPLQEARALLIASKKRSKYREDKTYRPVQFIPGHWFDLLKNRVEQSVEQMQYHVASLEAQRHVLEVTRNYLDREARKAENCNKPTIDNPFLSICPSNPRNDPDSIFNQFEVVQYHLENEVRISEMSRYECLVTRNPIDCHLYTHLFDSVVRLMDTYAELYFEVQFVDNALSHRDVSIPAISTTINYLSGEIDLLQTLVQVSLLDTADRDKKTDEKYEQVTKHLGLTDFDFSSSEYFYNSSELNFTLPFSVNDRPLWYINERSTTFLSDELNEEYQTIFNHLNTLHTNVSARLMRVHVHRRWFKPLVFGNSHIRMINDSIFVSPGVIFPPEDFQSSLQNGTYQLPLYPTSLILATNVKFTLNTPFPFHTLPTLLRMSHDHYVSGGYGPFQFGPQFQSRIGQIKFRVEARNERLVLTLPGTHLVGYLCDNVPQFPREPVSTRRGRRSIKNPSWKFEKNGLDSAKSSHLNNWILTKKKKVELDKEGFNELADNRGILNSAGEPNERLSSVTMTIVPTTVSEIHMYANASSLLRPKPGNEGRRQRKR